MSKNSIRSCNDALATYYINCNYHIVLSPFRRVFSFDICSEIMKFGSNSEILFSSLEQDSSDHTNFSLELEKCIFLTKESIDTLVKVIFCGDPKFTVKDLESKLKFIEPKISKKQGLAQDKLIQLKDAIMKKLNAWKHLEYVYNFSRNFDDSMSSLSSSGILLYVSLEQWSNNNNVSLVQLMTNPSFIFSPERVLRMIRGHLPPEKGREAYHFFHYMFPWVRCQPSWRDMKFTTHDEIDRTKEILLTFADAYSLFDFSITLEAEIKEILKDYVSSAEKYSRMGLQIAKNWKIEYDTMDEIISKCDFFSFDTLKDMSTSFNQSIVTSLSSLNRVFYALGDTFYHKESCRNIGNKVSAKISAKVSYKISNEVNVVESTCNDAIDQGLSPCPVCFPVISNATTMELNQVLATDIGNMYHKENCRYVRNQFCIKMNVKEAIMLGLNPCRVCYSIISEATTNASNNNDRAKNNIEDPTKQGLKPTTACYPPISSEATIMESNQVYVNDAGKKYHKENCRVVKSRNCRIINVEDATQQGLQPCKVCSNVPEEQIPILCLDENRTYSLQKGVIFTDLTSIGLDMMNKARLFASQYGKEHKEPCPFSYSVIENCEKELLKYHNELKANGL